jgi:TP901 family phage tail tape measure protein
LFVVGTVSAPIEADTRPFQLGLNDARRMGNNFISGIGNSVKSIGSTMASFGASFTKAITVPIVGAGVAIFKFGKDFEKEMSKVVGLVGVSSDVVEQWKNDILKMSPAVGKMPHELADAMFFVTSAGLRGAAALDVLRMSAKASAAGLGETKTIADLVTSAMNAYGQENLSAAKATDIITAAVREGKAEAAELAATMGAVLPLASEMGVTFDQVAATQAAMTKTGTDAAEAATQLKSIMAGLIKPSKQAEEQLSKMGTSSAEMRKKIKEDGLLSALMELKELTNKYGEEAMARVFPNIRALMGVLDLMGANLEANKETFKKVTNSTGMLEDAFKAASETTDFKFNQALSAIQATSIKFFDVLKSALVPVLETFVDVLGFVGDQFTGMTGGQQKLIAAFVTIAAVTGPAIMVFGTLIGIIGSAITGIGTIAGILSSIGLVIPAVIAGITLLIGGLSALILSSDDVRKGLSNAFNNIKKNIGGAIGFIKTHINDIKKAFKGLFEGLTTGNFGDFMSAMSNMVPPETMEKIHKVVKAFVKFQDFIIEVRDRIIELGQFLGELFAPAFSMLGETISNLDWTPALDGLTNLWDNIKPLLPVVQNLAAIIGVVLATAIGIVVAALNGIVSALPYVFSMISNLFSVFENVFSLIIGILTVDGELIKQSLINLWENINAVCADAISIVVNIFKGFVDGIIEWFQNLYDTLVGHSIIPDLVNSIITWFSKLPGKVIEKIKELVKNAIYHFNNFKESVSNKFKLLLIRIKDFVNKIGSEIKKLIKKGLEAGKNFLGGLIKTDFMQAGINIVKGIIKGIKSMFGEVSRVTRQLAENIRDFFPFSPAKVGPLKDLNKLNFADPIKSSISKANELINKDLMSNLVLNDIAAATIPATTSKSTSNNNFGNNFYGDMKFEGITDMDAFLNEMKSYIQLHTGRKLF